jgi:uncharacterized Tic20 family protein
MWPVSSPSPAPILPPAGWYHDGTGLRWWDGRAWGPYAPPAERVPRPADEVEAGRTVSILAHVGFFFLAVILPLIFRLTEGKKNAYVRHHSSEALNFQLTFLLVWIGLVVTFVIGAAAGWYDTTDETFEEATSAWVALPLALMFAIAIVGMVLSVVGAIRASQGRRWRYPVSIRFVRGAAPRSH